VPSGSGNGLLGFRGDTLIGWLSLPAMPSNMFFTLTQTSDWQALPTGPELPTDAVVETALAQCGYWLYQSTDNTLSYTALPGICPA
jgi:hypothetical protein